MENWRCEIYTFKSMKIGQDGGGPTVDGGSRRRLVSVGDGGRRQWWRLVAETQPKTGPKQRRAEEGEQDMVAAAGRRRP